MTSVRSRRLAVVVALVALAACKKEGGGDDLDLPAELRPHLAKIDPSRLAVPALFASIPADTPYLLASLDAPPPELWTKMKQVYQPLIDAVTAKSQEQQGKNAVLDAVLSEIEGKWNQAGIESLGFSSQPRFAIYGLGLQPAVIRAAIKDGKAVQATIERIAAKAGKQLPPSLTRGGRSYWQHADSDGTTVVVSIGDHELIAALGKTEDVEAKLGLILGLDRPARNMADGALVKQLMVRHGFGGQLIGFADTRQLAGKAVEAAGAAASPACTGALDRLSGKLPRLVLGYSELSGTKIAGALVVEMAPEVVADLRALKTEVPGLRAALSGPSLMAFAAGVNLARAQQLGGAAAGSLQQLGTACGLGALVDGAASAARGLAKPLPEPVGQISGAAVVVDALTLGASGTPEKIEGTALIASPDAHALFDKAGAMDPTIKSLGVTADGKLHDLHIPMPMPFALSAGVGDRTIVLAAGARARGAGDQLIGARASGKAPLFAMSYDIGKLMDFTEKANPRMALALNGAPAGFRAFMTSIKDTMGRVSGTLDVTDHGLAFWTSVELR
jgi:hypothetical protein